MADGSGPEHADKVGGRVSWVRRLARRRDDPLIVLPYLTYGTAQRLTVCGRVLQDEGFSPTRDTDRLWRNLSAFYKRLESDEVPGARVRATHLGVEVDATADQEGYFRLDMPTHGRLGPGQWQDVALELIHPAGDARATARVLVPSERASFAVISDIDDTIVASNVANKLRMLLTVAFTNSRTRKPFKGVAAFYRALHAGVNPVFYVSKSPWNLYVPLVEYLEVQGLPLGPLMLRDFGLVLKKHHKKKAIEDILATYPALAFVLIGDSAEADPEIYADIVRRFPKRIRAIYIRSVSAKRISEVERLVGEVAKTGCQLILAPEADLAAAHAAAEGLIQPPDLRAVRSDIEADTRASKPSASSGSLK
jgi:phosphatidate phosphatase APP1